MEAHRPLVFLDTNVVLGYLSGRLSWLFDEALVEKFRYVINPIVLQEVVLHSKDHKHPRRWDRVLQRIDMLPIDMQAADEILPRARELRNRTLHSNDILIMSSAKDCDYLLTSDQVMRALLKNDRPRIIEPEEFRHMVETYE